MDETTIRIFLIDDDHAVILPGLNSRFRTSRDHIEFAGCAGTVEEALRRADPDEFDLFFLDLYLPDSDPIENLRRLRAAMPRKPVIIYSTEQNPSWIMKTVAAGASAYLTKKDSRSVIKQTIRMVMEGKVVFKAQVTEEVEVLKTVSDPDQPFGLLPLEREVLKRMTRGASLGEIGAELAIGKNRVEKILQKLRQIHNVKNNQQLIYLFSSRGII